MRYRLTTTGDDMSIAERLMIENVIAWRIIAVTAAGILFSHWLTGKYADAGMSLADARVAVFATLNVAFFGACLKYWRHSIFPIAPRGWRRGTRARIAILMLVFHFGLLAFVPLNIQLSVALWIAWYKFNFVGQKG